MKLFRVKTEWRSVNEFLIRAESREAAKRQADYLVTGQNLYPYDANILEERDDDPDEHADND